MNSTVVFFRLGGRAPLWAGSGRLAVLPAFLMLLPGAALPGVPPVTPEPAAPGQQAPGPRITEIDSLVVVGTPGYLGAEVRPVADRDVLGAVLLNTPFVLIRRGAAAVSDLYADGFKRNDLTVTIDGERFNTACPNRMDTRVGQVDLLDIESVACARSGGGLQSGLGGRFDLRRRLPGERSLVYGRVGGAVGHAGDFEASLALEGRWTRGGARYRRSEAYTDAAGRTFSGMYGYVADPCARITELRGHRVFPGGDVQVTWESSVDVPFPYLLMDERSNDHLQASGSYRGQRIYFNRTRHLMDNALRTSWTTTEMVTDAAATTCGAVGDFYELYALNWDADNRITPKANPAAAKLSHMLPDVWRLGAGVGHELGDPARPWLQLHAGLVRTEAMDGSALDLHRQLYPDAEASRWSIACGATALHERDLNGKVRLTAAGEIASDAPGVEQQYITVDKPGATPDWLGNPGLKDPVRATARGGVQTELLGLAALNLEVFGTRVWEYPTLVRRTVGTAAVQTYAGVDALLAGAHLFGSWRLMDLGVSWNWGEKSQDDGPLAEIQPLTVSLTMRTPRFGRFQGRALYQHAAGQGRIDAWQGEQSTGAWNRLDLALAVEHDRGRLSLDLDNATNSLYTQHLSYQRSPFAAGLRVFEPGRTLRATAVFTF